MPKLALGLFALVLVDVMQLCIPWVIKWAVDDLEQGVATTKSLFNYGFYIMLLALGMGVLRFVWRFLIFGFARLVEMNLRNRLFSHLLTLDKPFFNRTTTGDIMAHATNDLLAVQMASGMGLVALIDAIMITIAATSLMIYINPTLAAIAILPMPFMILLARFLSRKLHKHYKKVQEKFSKLMEFTRSTISSIRLIKAYNQETSQTEHLNTLGKEYVKHNLKLSIIQGILFPSAIFISNISLLLVLFFGGRLTLNGIISSGDFVAFINYLLMLTWPMIAIGWVTNLFQRGATSLGRIRNLLNERPVIKNISLSNKLLKLSGKIFFKNLTFTYPGQSRPALSDINLKIGQGVLGIVGRTGAGKTTLCNLITRMFPVPDDTLFFDEHDVNTLPLSLARGMIAYVPQDVIIFSDTIANNIAMGRPGASIDEIQKAANIAAIHNEIMKMPNAYQTRVGEHGVKLSGGQKQRITIARAMLLEKPVIIIDDGMSAVDMETEQAIIKSIASYIKNRTCIIVSHRLAQLVDVKEIIVMDNGRIVAQGDHEKLLKQNSFYATIHKQQTNSQL